MIPRYVRPEMDAIWNRQSYFEYQLEVEKAVVQAWGQTGLVPKEDVKLINQATFSLGRIDHYESTSDHETDAFVSAVAETLGDESRWLHLGLTSSDVLDTALSLQLIASGRILKDRLAKLEEVVTHTAVEHRNTLTIGRSHGIHAEPTTFGFKMLIWVDELRRAKTRLDHALKNISVGKFSGSVGTHANVPPNVEESACKLLGLKAAPVSNQILQRDRHAHFVSTLAIIAGSIDKFATEVRNLQRTEIGEAEEPFEEGRHGSSSMPHKRNPSRSERITGLARFVRSSASVAFENMALWHERDISHSSAERIILPDSCMAVDYMLWLFTNIMSGLNINVDRMLSNMNLTHGLIYSQAILLALVDSGMTRQDAYAIVHKNAMAAFNKKVSLRTLLESDPEVTSRLNRKNLDEAFSPDRHLQHINTAYQRLGIEIGEAT